MFVEMDARGVASVVFRQMWKFLTVFVIITAAGLVYCLTAPRTYESNAQLLIKFGQDATPEMALGQEGGGTLSADEKRGLVQSNVSILTSRDIARVLLKDTGIDRAYPEIAAKAPDPDRAMNDALKKFADDLATKTEGDAGIINVTLNNKNPQLAASMLKHLLDLFIQNESQIYGNPQTPAMRAQADDAYQKSQEAHKALYEYQQKVGVASIDEELTLLLKERSDIAGYVSRRQDPAAGTASVTGVLPARIASGGDPRFPVVDDVQKRIDELKAKETELRQTYRPDSPVIKNIQANIATQSGLLNTSVRALNTQLADLDAKIAQMRQYKEEFDNLSRDAAFKDDALKTAQTRLQAAEINNDLNQRKITRVAVLEQPITPVKPSHPRKALIMALCLLAGAALGGAAAMIAESLDQSFSLPEQVTAALGQPVLASFPYMLVKRRKRGFRGPAEKILEPQDKIALYHAIKTALNGNGHGSVYFTSAYAGEGATTVGLEIAALAAESFGLKSLFIDTDLWTGDSGEPVARAALSDVAAGRAVLENAISVLAGDSGRLHYAYLAEEGRGGEILGHLEKLGALIGQLKQSYDFVVLSGSAAMNDPVRVALSRFADGTVLVIEAETTRAPVARQALQLLSGAGGRVIGVVLNKKLYHIPHWLYRSL